MIAAGFVSTPHAVVSPGQQVLAVVIAVAVMVALKAWLWLRSRPRRKHLRAARRNGSMLARPGLSGRYQRRW